MKDKAGDKVRVQHIVLAVKEINSYMGNLNFENQMMRILNQFY